MKPFEEGHEVHLCHNVSPVSQVKSHPGLGEGGFMGNFWKEGRGGRGGEEEAPNERVVLAEMDAGD